MLTLTYLWPALTYIHRMRQETSHMQGSTTRDVTARNLGASRSTVSASKPTFFALKIVNALSAKIVKAVKRGGLSSMGNMVTPSPISSKLLMLPLLELSAMPHLQLSRRGKTRNCILGHQPRIRPFISLANFHRYHLMILIIAEEKLLLVTLLMFLNYDQHMIP